MGIEKYFQMAGGSSKKESTTKSKPEPASRKRPAPADKTKTKIEKEDNDDFQESPKSKHFSAPLKTEKNVDPKAFFGSSKASAAKATTPAPSKPVATAKKTTSKKEVEPKKQIGVISDNDDELILDHPILIAPPEAMEAMRKQRGEDKAREEKATKKKTKEKKTYVISDSEDDFEDDKDEDFEDDEPVVKKVKLDPKKPSATKAASKAEPKDKPTASIKKEVDQVEKPTKKNYFQIMKNQEGPKALGTRPEPNGASNCLNGLTFVISGQYETLTRDQTKDIIMRYGGRTTTAVSGKTSYLCYGRDAGESKLTKAKQLGTKILDEDEFYHLVESSAPQKEEFAVPPQPKKGAAAKASDSVASIPISKEEHNTKLWTEKYKPNTVNEIVGNKELVKRINEWLQNWQTNFKKGFEGEGEDLNNWCALLLSGPPGIGKTTTAKVVAQANGYESLEFNASDVRSKKVLEESITEMMDNRTMTEFFQAKSKAPVAPRLLKGKKVVLIMDEVDGMSGGDRGGAVELAALIRKSKIPVICICNDSRSKKVAPLLRVCFEAKFKRTPANQIRSRILSIAFKEKLKITPNAVDELVQATHNDIRQIINILSTYRLGQGDMNYDQAKAVGKNNEKYTILGLFDIPLELMTAGAYRAKDLNQLYEVYFHEYNLAHLIVQENYLRFIPERSRALDGNPIKEACDEMDLFAKAADAMADGDLVDSMIHGTVQHYSLMPVHSIFSCVRPASYVRGGIRTKIMFPAWLGQNSKAGKYSRNLSDIQTRMRLKASGDKYEIRQNYVPTLNARIFGELMEENYDGAIEYMDNYYLDRENIDTLSELTFTQPKEKQPLMRLSTKVKSTFTRTYNGQNHPILFQISGVPIKKSVSGPKEDAEGTIIEEEVTFGDDISEEEAELNKEDDPEQDLQNIKYIKEATPKKRKAAASTNGSTKKLKSKK